MSKGLRLSIDYETKYGLEQSLAARTNTEKSESARHFHMTVRSNQTKLMIKVDIQDDDHQSIALQLNYILRLYTQKFKLVL